MGLNIPKEVGAMKRLTTRQLKDRYEEAFGEVCRSNHKQWLIKRIAWRLQANEEGDLSERARRRAMELANDADLRMKAPPQKKKATPAPTARKVTGTVAREHDDRLPKVPNPVGVDSESPPTMVTFSKSIPNSSAAIWAKAVYVPCPISAAAVRTIAVPS